jgi:hypothetical protein
MLSKTTGEAPVASKIRSKGPNPRRAVQDGNVRRALVARAQGLDQVGVEVGLGRAPEDGHLEPPKPERERGQEADRPGTHHRRAARPPDLEPALDFVSLGDRR